MDQIEKSGLTLYQAKKMADAGIREVKNGFIGTGYYLGLIRNERLWENHYRSFQEFLETSYGKDKSWASRCISLYEQFGTCPGCGELPELAEPYREYTVSQLIEMVSMTGEQRQQVTPDMPVRQIREMKPKRRKEEELPGEISAEEPEGEPEEQIPGQMDVTDCPGAVATSQLPEPGDAVPENQEEDGKDSRQQDPRGDNTETGTEPEKTTPGDAETGTEPEESVLEDTETGAEPEESVPEDTETGPECQETDQEMEGPDPDTEFTTAPGNIHELPAAYDRRILEEMIRKATEEMDVMWDHWAEHVPDVYTKHTMQIQAYRNLLDEHEGKQEAGGEPEKEPVQDPVQPELPVLKNDGQRKEWLRNYRDWGLWYEDQNIGAKYYRYIFDNGATLVVDEYQYDTYEGGAEYTASFLHLVGGPEPARHTNYGEHKWPYRQRYSRNPDSETELVEFLKALQKKGK